MEFPELKPVEQIEEYARFINNSGDIPQTVAIRKSNAFGVYDLLGNVREWVDDWYVADSYTQALATDPRWLAGGAKVCRGGSCHCPVHLLRPGYRAANKPGIACEVNGFHMIAELR